MPRNYDSNESPEQYTALAKSVAEYISTIPNTIIFGSLPREILSGGNSFNDIDVLTTSSTPYEDIIQTLLEAFSPSIQGESVNVFKVGAREYGNINVESFAKIQFYTPGGRALTIDLIRPLTGTSGAPVDILRNAYIEGGDISANFTYIEDGIYCGINNAKEDAIEKKIRILRNFNRTRMNKMMVLMEAGWSLVPSMSD